MHFKKDDRTVFMALGDEIKNTLLRREIERNPYPCPPPSPPKNVVKAAGWVEDLHSLPFFVRNTLGVKKLRGELLLFDACTHSVTCTAL